MRVASRQPVHRVTTAHLGAAYPFMAEAGLGSRGTYIGRDLMGNGAFCYDVWELRRSGVLSGPNMAVIGKIGMAKSALVKTFVWRQQVFGRRSWMLDPKGENSKLCQAVGVEPIRLRPNGDIRLNPLDPPPGDVSNDEVARGQIQMLQAVIEAGLRRDLSPEEWTACDLALRQARAEKDRPALPDVIRALFAPRSDLAALVGSTAERVAQEGRPAALELRRLCEGDLKGMFDGPTSGSIDLEGPLVSLDLKAVYDSRRETLGILMVCAAAWLRRELLRRDGRKHILVVDEGWFVVKDLGTARWMQSTWKLARDLNVQCIVVAHRPSDLSAAGPVGSEQAQIATGLFADSETRVIYGQPHDQIEDVRRLCGLTQAEAELVTRLQKGMALWKVGERSFLVEHLLGPGVERDLVETEREFVG